MYIEILVYTARYLIVYEIAFKVRITVLTLAQSHLAKGYFIKNTSEKRKRKKG